MTHLRIHLFGGLSLFWDDQPLPVPSTAARSLLAYLVTYRAQLHTRDLLAGIFWSDLPDAVARRRLSQALWQIRRTLTPVQNALDMDVLLTEGDTVQLNPRLPLWIDVDEFVKLQTPSSKLQIPNSKSGIGIWSLELAQPTACGILRDAVALYRGEFLAGYYDDWVLTERERLREILLQVLERLIDACKVQGEYEEALVYARRLVAQDPWREEAHCEVMRLCHLLGRDNEALQQYQACCQVLADDLGTEPSANTTGLAREIAALSGAAGVPHLPVAAPPPLSALLERPDQMPLVGRQAERAVLAQHLDLAVAGNGGMVLLAGEAGVGKTRLVQEVARDAAWRGIRVSWGHCCELCAPPPYQPLVEVLHGADLTHLPAVWQQELGRLLPDLGSPLPALEPMLEKSHLLEALARAFLALGHTRSHLVILEDMHWMDLASYEALRALLPRLPTSRLLVIGTLRPEDLAEQPVARRSLAALEATRIPRRLDVAPLTEAEAEALIRQTLALTEPAPRFSRRIHAQTAGNPFFLAETLRALAAEGLLYRDAAGEWHTPWDGTANGYAELPIPPSIAQSIERRLARLSPTVRDLLCIAAVVGRRVEYDLWLAAGERDEATTLAAAEELAGHGLLVETDDAQGYRFVHDIIRQVVYGNQSAVRRRKCHHRVATALESLHPDWVEALARHYRLGQNWPSAVRYAVQAGERAQAVYAHQQALAYYGQADAWLAESRVTWPTGQAWSEDQVARVRADLAEKQGQVQSLMGEYEAARESFTRARQMWADLGDWRGEARVLNRSSFLCFVQDDTVGASQHAERALAVLPGGDPQAALRATSLTNLGLSARIEGRYDDALLPLEEALVLFEAAGTDSYGLARCLNSLGLVYLERGDLDRADPCLARSLALRQQIGDRRGAAWCWHNQGRTALARDDLTTARAKLETAQAIFAEIQNPDGLGICARTLRQLEQAETAALQAGQIVVRLPRADAPTGRPLRDDEHVTVSWTVDAPGDAGMRGKAARRRHRLLRLLAEARAQGAAPAHKHLAAALGVSQRTIERDMAVLRREVPDVPPTRGKMSE